MSATRTLPVAAFSISFTYLISRLYSNSDIRKQVETVSTNMHANGHFALQIAAKPLQIAT